MAALGAGGEQAGRALDGVRRFVLEALVRKTGARGLRSLFSSKPVRIVSEMVVPP